MTWSISRSGPKSEVLDSVRAESFPNLAEGSPEKACAKRWRDAIADAVEAEPDGAVSVGASGWHDPDGKATVSISVSTTPAVANQGGFVGLVVAIVIAVIAMLAGAVQLAHAPAVDRPSALAEAAWMTAPRDLATPDRAAEHAAAAIAAERGGVSAELLLAAAYSETRYDATHVGAHGPHGLCGALQATATSDLECTTWGTDIAAGYAAGAEQIAAWRRACSRASRRGAWSTIDDCALAGYGGGWRAVAAGTSTYPARVAGRARRIRRLERSLGYAP